MIRYKKPLTSLPRDASLMWFGAGAVGASDVSRPHEEHRRSQPSLLRFRRPLPDPLTCWLLQRNDGSLLCGQTSLSPESWLTKTQAECRVSAHGSHDPAGIWEFQGLSRRFCALIARVYPVAANA